MRQIFIIAVNFEMCLACVDLSSSSLSSRLRFYLNDPSKNDSDVVGWRSLLARSASRVPGLMELFYRRLDFAGRSILYIRTDESRTSYFRGSVRKRGTERNGIPVQSMDSSRATGATKRPGFRERRGRMRRIGTWEGAARDTQRPVGIICTSLGWRWPRLVGTCANACRIVH